MDIKKIIFWSLIILIIYLIIVYFSSSAKELSKLQNGNEPIVIESNKLDEKNGISNNYTYSIWFYLNDWNYKYGEEKILFSRSNSNNNNEEFFPKVYFDKMTNDIKVKLNLYPNDSSQTSVSHTCTVNNFPLQSWVNLIVSLYNRSLDIYLDGKLVRTCVLPGIAKINSSSNVFLTPNGGFSGLTSKFEYFNHASNPQEAYNIYKKGYGGNILGNVFNKYKLRLSLYKGNKETNAIEL